MKLLQQVQYPRPIFFDQLEKEISNAHMHQMHWRLIHVKIFVDLHIETVPPIQANG